MVTSSNIISNKFMKCVIFTGHFLISLCLVLMEISCSRHEIRPVVDSTDQEIREIRDPDIHFVPTPYEVVEKMLEMADVKRSDLLYDLGCGDGRIVITAAKKYGCQCVGYDIDPERVIESIENVKTQKMQKLVRIEQNDVFTLDLSKADVVTLYLLESLNVKLIPQLEKFKPGTRIVSHDFSMNGIVIPDRVETITTDNLEQHTIYLWTTPLLKTKMLIK